MTTYITTPIYYVNALPHLGHAYSTIVADAYGRYKKLCGESVRFQTGTDEHGEKIAQAAESKNLSPREYVDGISTAFRDTWPMLAIEADKFIRTTDPLHIKTVQDILQLVYDKGDIYFSEYSGLYCQGCERFLTEKELVDGKCPDHLTAPTEIAEQNYFFRMSNYQQWLINHIKENPEFITPQRYRNEVLSFLSEPLEDLCISRPVSRLTWGIPLPFDEKFVTYVWFDALINYLTGLGYPQGNDFAKFWPVAEHIIAKDILKPHAIFWPTMLKSMGLEPYKRLHVHGYWNVDETKMSKSIGNVVRPAELVDAYGVDTVRYFVLREMSFGLDASFGTEAITARHNSDLANDLGNVFSRCLTMIHKYTGGTVPAVTETTVTAEDRELIAAIAVMHETYRKAMEEFGFNRALAAVWEIVGRLNRYVVTNAPWELAKDETNTPRLHTVLYFLAETLRIIALVTRPFMPGASQRMEESLELGEELRALTLDPGVAWGQTVVGTRLRNSAQLFPRLEKKKKDETAPAKIDKPVKEEKAMQKAAQQVEQKSEPEEGVIEYGDFQKVELRVAKITAAEKVKKADKLLKLTLLAPEERTVVAGIAKYYAPEELVGKQVIIVANLKPRKLMGETSHGMVLAAKETTPEGEERLVLSTVSADIAPGSRVA
ncbi:MAG: methionine--tRNA ligase [Desulfobulbaceae bacterium]|nr:methionine--tRNA ligase [Desulfobulbaceae bacterium]